MEYVCWNLSNSKIVYICKILTCTIVIFTFFLFFKYDKFSFAYICQNIIFPLCIIHMYIYLKPWFYIQLMFVENDSLHILKSWLSCCFTQLPFPRHNLLNNNILTSSINPAKETFLLLICKMVEGVLQLQQNPC